MVREVDPAVSRAEKCSPGFPALLGDRTDPFACAVLVTVNGCFGGVVDLLTVGFYGICVSDIGFIFPFERAAVEFLDAFPRST